MATRRIFEARDACLSVLEHVPVEAESELASAHASILSSLLNVYITARLVMGTMRIDLHELRRIIIEALLNAYEVLGVQQGATDDEIKAAWKKLALQNHPDRGGSHGKMVDINNAKDRLLNKTDLFRFGARIKGYETAAPPPAAAPAGAQGAALSGCPLCGRSVAVKDGKFVNHYFTAGGPEKCPNSGHAKQQPRDHRNDPDDFWNRGRNAPPPRDDANQGTWAPSRSRPGYDYNTYTGQYRPSQGGARQQPPPPPPPRNAPPPRSSATDRRYFEFRLGRSRKFWEVSTERNAISPAVKIRWGRIGTAGQEKTKTFGTFRSMRQWVSRMAAGKVGKGYVEVANPPAGQQGAPPPGPRAAGAAGQAAAGGRPTKDSYKVYGWRGGRRVVRIGGKLYGTGQGGNLSGGGQTQFNANDRARVTPDGNNMKVKKPDSDHTQTWTPVDEVRHMVDEIVMETIIRIASTP
jgi:curved DNA-binding protein CbpA